MNADIYERHRAAVAKWRDACADVASAEQSRDEARQVLDNIGQELLASCADSTSKPEKKTRRRRGKHLEAIAFTEEQARNLSKIGPFTKANGAAVQG